MKYPSVYKLRQIGKGDLAREEGRVGLETILSEFNPRTKREAVDLMSEFVRGSQDAIRDWMRGC